MRQEMLEVETQLKGNLKSEMKLFNTIFKKISEEFKRNIGKEQFNQNSVQLLDDLWKSLKGKLSKKQGKINLNEWISNERIIKMKSLFDFNVNELNLKLKNLTLLIQELIDLLISNFDLIISECKKFNRIYLPSTVDLVTILKKYAKFISNDIFIDTQYLKFIFKELFSNLDKIAVDYSLIKTAESICINESKQMDFLWNEKLLLFKMLVWEKKIDKWNIIILEKFDNKQNIISFKILKNKILKEVENDKMWVTLKIHRDKFEHSWADYFLDNIFKNKNTNFIHFIVYLIGLNIFLLENIWNIK